MEMEAPKLVMPLEFICQSIKIIDKVITVKAGKLSYVYYLMYNGDVLGCWGLVTSHYSLGIRHWALLGIVPLRSLVRGR